MAMSALQKEKPQVATKRPAAGDITEESSWRRVASTQPVSAFVASWKRVKTESNEGFLTQPQQSVQPQKPMLGAWFGAAARMAARPAPAPAASQASVMSQAFTRVKAEVSMSQDSEDDKPLARVVGQQQQRAWGQQQQQQQKARAKTAAKPLPPQATLSFATAREAALAEALESARSVRREDVKPAAVTRVKGQEDERVFQLSSKRRVTVRRWKSAVLVDIREYYDDNGVSKPGKKGISLAKDQWNTLLRLSRVIDQAVDLVEDDSVDGHSLEQVSERVPVNQPRTIAFTLSSKRRITVSYFRSAVLIDLREYYEQGSEMKPGKKGISLSKDQWRSLQTTQAEISDAILEV